MDSLPWANGGCPSAFLQTSRVIPTVIFVIDGSGSMDSCLGSSGGSGVCTTRWESMRRALLQDGEILSRFESVVRFGMVLFSTPELSGRKCPDLRAVWPGLDNRSAIEDALPLSSLGGATPTPDAVRYAIDVMFRPAAPDQFTVGPTYVLLATDGLPNGCDTDNFTTAALTRARNRVVEVVEDGADKGIRTFVMSLADDVDYDHLVDIAEAGEGQREPFQPDNVDDLIGTIRTVVDGVIGCEIILDGYVQPEHACDGNVRLNGRPLPCEDPDGWWLREANRMELLGTACEEFKDNFRSELSAEFDCSIQRPD